MELHYLGDSLKLSIHDNGKGFVTNALLNARHDAQHGLGLVGMRERAMLVGATLMIASLPGEGCSVVLSLPLSESEKSSSPQPLEHPI